MKIKNGLFMTLVFGLCLAVSTALQAKTPTAQANAAFPSTFAEFEKTPAKDMKGFPEAKWDLTKKVTASDLEGKPETEIILLRNSIFAQHGFRFANPALANYFLSRSWYKPILEFNPDTLSQVSKDNVAFFMKQQTRRNVSSALSYQQTQVAFNLFRMGFCTYEVSKNPKAGMVVFEPGGRAQVYHSKASASQFEAYAYEFYLEPDMKEYGNTLLIEATWSVEVSKNKANVLIEYSDETRKRYRDPSGSEIIAPGKRLVLSIDLDKKDPFAFVQQKTCTMNILK